MTLNLNINQNKIPEKTLRYLKDEQEILKLKSDLSSTKNSLNKSEHAREDLYQLLLSYQKICDDNMAKSKELLIEIDSLKDQLTQATYDLNIKTVKIQQLTHENEMLRKKTKILEQENNFVESFDYLLNNLQKNQHLEKLFHEKVGTDSKIMGYNIADTLKQFIGFCHCLIPLYRPLQHKKNLSCEENWFAKSGTMKNMLNMKKNDQKDIFDMEKHNFSTKNPVKIKYENIDCIQSTRSTASLPNERVRPKVIVCKRINSLT
ncbi:hypothetical protein SteCoe_14375 [Stentor coeruleus]|uniref:Uncharacterized protein n=1 Tax=Stentor coeruleus TaxID=5963 RepID=A0A1R2C681_9CILI|nr:hypothetical protein SteCoe_15321 [Stentor coeruleus]OMJ84490.1 hypothetical protein SteCoe_14375 [Stentor coeruleus]